ncbi:MAG: TolC family protein [Pirellulales bacterium]|nr:TolC family protein [Pirellulales bacterium]
MHLPRIAIIAIVALTAAGCRCPSSCCLPATPHARCDLPSAAVPDAQLDLTRLLADAPPDAALLQTLPSPDETYQILTPGDCQCRAATNANIANMVELEEHWAATIIECDSKIVQQNLCLQRDLLELHAADVRNKAAATALEAYYQLAGLEARRQYLEQAILETTRSLQRADKLRSSGLPVDVDRDSLALRLGELEDQRLQLHYARVQLNGQLQKQLGCPVSEHDFFWPQLDWRPKLAPIDAEAELAAGLPNRFDLRGVSLVLCNLEKTTLRVARGVLGVADSTLGSVEPTEGLVHRLRCINCSDHELDVRCRQLTMLYNDTEQLATAEIKSAVYQVTLQQQRVALAYQAAGDRQAHLQSLLARREAEDVAVFEISAARGRVFDAQAKLIEQIAALKVAEVRLRRSQAALAAECGLEPKLCCEGSCRGYCTRCQARTCRPGELPCRCEKCCQK